MLLTSINTHTNTQVHVNAIQLTGRVSNNIDVSNNVDIGSRDNMEVGDNEHFKEAATSPLKTLWSFEFPMDRVYR